MNGVYVSKKFSKVEQSFPSAVLAVVSLGFGGLNNQVAPYIAHKHGLLVDNFLLVFLNFVSMILILASIYIEQKEQAKSFFDKPTSPFKDPS